MLRAAELLQTLLLLLLMLMPSRRLSQRICPDWLAETWLAVSVIRNDARHVRSIRRPSLLSRPRDDTY